MELIKKYWFVLFLLVLAIILILIKIKYSENNISDELKSNNTIINQGVDLTGTDKNTNETIENIDKTEEVTVTPVVTEKTEKISKATEYGDEYYFEGDLSDNMSDYRSGDTLEILLPYKGEYFRIEKYLKPGYLEVIVKDDDNLSKARQEVDNWLKNNNTDSEETQLIYVFEN